MIYLDNAATSFLKPSSVYRAAAEAMKTCASVGRGGYAQASNAGDIVYNCREELSELFSVRNIESATFTYNATVALNMAIKALAVPESRIVCSGYEHNAVARPLAALAKRGIPFETVNAPLWEPGCMLDGFREALENGANMAVCTHVSNVFGYILPVYELDGICSEYGVPLIIDASQSAGHIPLDISRLKSCAFVCMPGHKGLFGPQGTGVLFALAGKGTDTIIEGGTGSNSASFAQPDFLPDRFESGTHNVPGIAGLCEGIKYIRSIGIVNAARYEASLTERIADGLISGGFKVFRAGDPSMQSGVLSFIPKNISPERFAELMATAGIAVRAGLHCAPMAHKTAGTIDKGTVRVSVSVLNTPRECDRFIASAVTADTI